MQHGMNAIQPMRRDVIEAQLTDNGTIATQLMYNCIGTQRH